MGLKGKAHLKFWLKLKVWSLNEIFDKNKKVVAESWSLTFQSCPGNTEELFYFFNFLISKSRNNFILFIFSIFYNWYFLTIIIIYFDLTWSRMNTVRTFGREAAWKQLKLSVRLIRWVQRTETEDEKDRKFACRWSCGGRSVLTLAR